MTWYAKPRGSYSIDSTEAASNMFEVASILSGYTDEAIAAVLGNSAHEGVFNPWRWQGDKFGRSRGYGLFQFTPASDYIDLSGATPNLSVTEQTQGATPQDGAFQVRCLKNDTLGKWGTSCWRSYWNDDQGNPKYPTLYRERQRILNIWGNGSSISQSQFAQITNIHDATFVFLACYEGPRVPNLDVRVRSANKCYEIITGNPPAQTNAIYVNVTGNGSAYVSNPYPVDGEVFTLYAYPAQGEYLIDITARGSQGQAIAMSTVTTQSLPYNQAWWGNFIIIDVVFSGQTPPTPPTPSSYDLIQIILFGRRHKRKRIFRG